VAYVSQKPGKTRLLSFFDVGEHYRLVDLPGYGYAARDLKEIELWNQMITNYISQRGCLIGMILICDIRREWTEDEEMIFKFTQTKKMNFCCVLSKVDKLNKNELNVALKRWQKSSNRGADFFHMISNLKKTGVKEFENFIFKKWVKS
jgi:GTP-binding protein